MNAPLPFGITSLDALIEARCMRSRAASRRQFAELREYLNRSFGQQSRYTRERFARIVMQYVPELVSMYPRSTLQPWR